MAWSRRLSLIGYLVFCITLWTTAQGNEIVFSDYYVEEPATLYSEIQPEVQQRNLPQQAWDSARAGLDYSGTPRTKRKTSLSLPNLSPLGNVIQIVAVVLLVLLLIGVIILARRGNIFGKKIPRGQAIATQRIDELEENLMESDLEAALQQALQHQQYRLAIRIYYLITIRQLTTAQLIQWKKDKTNGDYLREMSGNNLLPDFRRLTVAFEQAWYGDRELQAQHFELLRPQFDAFIHLIRSEKRV